MHSSINRRNTTRLMVDVDTAGGSWTSGGPCSGEVSGNWFSPPGTTASLEGLPKPRALGATSQSFWVSRSKVGPIDMHFWQGHKGLRSFWLATLWDGAHPPGGWDVGLDFMEEIKKTILKPQNMRNDGPEATWVGRGLQRKRQECETHPIVLVARDWKFPRMHDWNRTVLWEPGRLFTWKTLGMWPDRWASLTSGQEAVTLTRKPPAAIKRGFSRGEAQ